MITKRSNKQSLTRAYGRDGRDGREGTEEDRREQSGSVGTDGTDSKTVQIQESEPCQKANGWRRQITEQITCAVVIKALR